MKASLIQSISGIRGKIEGKAKDTLTEQFVKKIIKNFILTLKTKNYKILLGRDGRKSGVTIKKWIIRQLKELNVTIVDVDYTITPTIALAVKHFYDGGIMITASHNTEDWNGIKLFNSKGENLSADEWNLVYNCQDIENKNFDITNSKITKISSDSLIEHHISQILNLDVYDKSIFKNKNLKIAIDGINSYGGIALKYLLNSLGFYEIVELNFDICGYFERNPEPNEDNLENLCKLIKKEKCDIGFALDPDGDRLAVVDENGKPWGEEYTLIISADYVLQTKYGNVVSNLSSSMLLEKIVRDYKQQYFPSKVGEVNVIEKMKKKKAIIGGEGNGGVIYPNISYCRDSLVATFFILSNMLKNKLSASAIRKNFPNTIFFKEKVNIQNEEIDFLKIINILKINFKNEKFIQEDGLKIIFSNFWIHIRKSNTEPIIRLYAECYPSEKDLTISYMDTIKKIIQEKMKVVS